jgi:hypothetical protein
MILTKSDKEYLKWLTSHPWYKILERIETQASNDLWELLLSGDLEDTAVLDMIKKNQLYAKARKDFFSNITTHIAGIYTPNI